MKNTLPKKLKYKLKNIYTKEELKIVNSGFKTEKRKPIFRVNTLKANEAKTVGSLEKLGLKLTKLPFPDKCYILENGREKDLWDSGAFKAGYIYMQGISSQIPVNFMDIKSGEYILDTTSAPGSKTSQISEKLNNTGKIVAVDNNAIRIDKLNFTLNKQGCKNVEVVKCDARNLNKTPNPSSGELYKDFHHILFDAPCSAEGRMNCSIEKSYSFWDETTNKRNYKLQKQILQNIVPLLRVGGSLIYSTCTLSPEENEAVVHMILCNNPDLKIEKLEIPDSKYIKTKSGLTKFQDTVYKKEVESSLRILPNEFCEGFFVAKFVKV